MGGTVWVECTKKVTALQLSQWVEEQASCMEGVCYAGLLLEMSAGVPTNCCCWQELTWKLCIVLVMATPQAVRVGWFAAAGCWWLAW